MRQNATCEYDQFTTWLNDNLIVTPPVIVYRGGDPHLPSTSTSYYISLTEHMWRKFGSAVQMLSYKNMGERNDSYIISEIHNMYMTLLNYFHILVQ